MHLPLSSAITQHLEVLEQCGSTNTELVGRASGADSASWSDFSVLVTDNQTGGRGRLGRSWIAPPGQAIAISVLLRPVGANGQEISIANFGWFPLMAGLAMTSAVATLLPSRSVTLKWPNDVQVEGLKISGLLAELLPGGTAVVMGAGLNIFNGEADLPTPVSTSIVLNDPAAPAEELADLALSSYLRRFSELYAELLRWDGDAVASGLAGLLAAACSTIGQHVRVQLPGGQDLVGMASGIDDTGRLLVARSTDGEVVAVAAGDVTHLRYE
ncbi:MAG: biotin--[acetyl-CoA-carboxylase] ligase [Microbacteriaceae bacterium]|nr:biotin--[acetyl-CoA-carboxylase] ligase [Microbacteriaceae bacterium]